MDNDHFKETIRSLNKNKIVWITLINKGYIDFTKNFIKSIERSNIAFKFILFCIDDESFDTFNTNAFGASCVCMKANFLQQELPSEFHVFGELNYKKIVFAKLDAIAYTLNNTLNLGVKWVGFIDTDIVLFSDPTNVMIRAINEDPDVSIFCSCDEDTLCCRNIRNCGNICSGMIVFKNQPVLYHFFQYTAIDVDTFYGDQDFLLQKLQSSNVIIQTIDKTIFANGSYPGLKDRPVDLPEQMCSLHFNYMVGLDKVHYMKLQNMWYL